MSATEVLAAPSFEVSKDRDESESSASFTAVPTVERNECAAERRREKREHDAPTA